MPLDEALGIAPYQQHSEEVIRLGCLFSLVMPYELASWMLSQWSGLSVSAASLWNWVQQRGQQVQAELMEQLQAQASGAEVSPDPLEATLATLPLAIGADGVMVPFRPTPKTAKGKIQWREVKVGILARLGTRLTQAGVAVPKLLHHRLVAVLGDIDQFIPHLQLEAQRQAFEAAPQVIWLSDGGRGFWRVYQTCFSHCAIAVLDFFHAAGQLARATQALFGEKRSAQARAWFRRWRYLLRHGRTRDVLRALTALLNSKLFCGTALDTLVQVQAYFQRHYRHMQYQQFARQQIPLGSGMVESACKWLIQQRFKGVGMRWSEDGFNHLLLLRLAWVNQRFESLFPHVPDPPTSYSPDR
ncbi:hypothetical protein XM38_038340 [Halomicronema hongdechloris C2206]|uniref:ISKra4 family transposase n=1 Tax=Halomicronema hongdechloris C2206 TaxID=1641165 RepID=A0A1Z3HRC4_9CYAN|nr:hypothetical protein XM38_038340 [Halomicronema hongdechloris C2206]